MTVRAIILWPEPWLSEPSDPVLPEEFGKAPLTELCQDLQDTLQEFKGAGLASPQISVLKQVLVMVAPPLVGVETTTLCICNPVLSDLSETKASDLEGCLSFPGATVMKERSVSVKLSGKLMDGSDYSQELSGFHARVAQHEVDHLRGITMADNIGPVKRDVIRRKINSVMKAWGRARERAQDNIESSRELTRKQLKKAPKSDAAEYVIYKPADVVVPPTPEAPPVKPEP